MTPSSRQFSSASGPLSDKEKYEKYLKIVTGLAAAFACLSFLGGMVATACYYVLESVNKGVDAKLSVEREATSAKLEAEKVHREAFQTLAAKTHLDTLRMTDQIVADLRLQFNNLYGRVLEGQHLESFYRSQIVKAQEVMDRDGVNSSSEVHVQLLSKINKMQEEINVLTKEISILGMAHKNPSTDALEGAPKDTDLTVHADAKNSNSAAPDAAQKGVSSTGTGAKDKARTNVVDGKNSNSDASHDAQKAASSTGTSALDKERTDAVDGKDTRSTVPDAGGAPPSPPPSS